MSSKVI